LYNLRKFSFLSLIIMLAIFSITAAGCGGGKKEPAANSEAQPEKRELAAVSVGTAPQANEILSLLPGVFSSKKGIFVGTGAGLYFYDIDAKAAAQVVDNEGILKNAKIKAICQEEGGKLWLGTDNEIFAYNFTSVRKFDENKVQAIIQTNGGEIWAATNYGLLLYDGNKGFSKFTKKSDNLPNDDVVCFGKEEKAKGIYAGTRQGLIIVDGPKLFSVKTGTSSKITPSGEVIEEPGNTEMAGNTVSAIAANSKGVLYIGTNMGVNRCKNFNNWSVFSADSEVTTKTSAGIGFKKVKGNSELLSNWIRSIYIDGDDSLWIATTKGLSYFNGDNKWENFTTATGLASNTVNAVSGINKAVFIGTASGLFILDFPKKAEKPVK